MGELIVKELFCHYNFINSGHFIVKNFSAFYRKRCISALGDAATTSSSLQAIE
jgi:hypothetical protein